MSRRSGNAPRASGSGGGGRGANDASAFDAQIADSFDQLDPANLNKPLDKTTLVNNLRTLISEVMTISKEYKKALEAFNDAGAEMAECGADDEVEKADIHVRDIISLQAEAEFRKQVLEEMRERANRGEELSDLSKLYSAGIEKKKQAWEAMSARKRYANSAAYKTFRERVWEGKGTEEPMPNIKTYLPLEEGEAAEESDDEELEVGGGRAADFKCPLCITFLKSPVKSTVCIHAFCKACFDDWWNQNARADQLACPVSGCNKHLTRTSVEEDNSLANRVKQYQRQQERRRNEDEEVDDEDEEMEDVQQDTKPRAKAPQRTQRAAHRGATQRKRAVVVADSDDDE